MVRFIRHLRFHSYSVTNMLFFLIRNIIIREKVSILFYFCYIYTESKGVVTLFS